MIAHGTSKELIRAIEEEKNKLAPLKGRDKNLDNFIERKIKILNECLNIIKKTKKESIQIVALSKCFIIEL
ncbi:MAG: type II/IV secretion system protein [Thermoproteus sp.]|nr:type II/IV secretion system protein [Thermoproteus sp.]